MCSLTMRAVTSVPPPAGNGTIMVIGRDGNGWADAASIPANVATNATMENKFFMIPPAKPIMAEFSDHPDVPRQTNSEPEHAALSLQIRGMLLFLACGVAIFAIIG